MNQDTLEPTDTFCAGDTLLDGSPTERTVLLTAHDLDNLDDLARWAQRLHHLAEVLSLDLVGHFGEENPAREVSLADLLSEQLESFEAQLASTATALRGRASMMKETRP